MHVHKYFITYFIIIINHTFPKKNHRHHHHLCLSQDWFVSNSFFDLLLLRYHSMTYQEAMKVHRQFLRLTVYHLPSSVRPQFYRDNVCIHTQEACTLPYYNISSLLSLRTRICVIFNKSFLQKMKFSTKRVLATLYLYYAYTCRTLNLNNSWKKSRSI